jgi:putative transposase
MKTQGWRAKATKRYKATTNSNHSLPVAPQPVKSAF